MASPIHCQPVEFFAHALRRYPSSHVPKTPQVAHDWAMILSVSVDHRRDDDDDDPPALSTPLSPVWLPIEPLLPVA